MDTLIGRVIGIQQDWGETKIVEVMDDRKEKAVLKVFDAEFFPGKGSDIKALGKWVESRYGLQFQTDCVIEAEPFRPKAMVEYITNATDITASQARKMVAICPSGELFKMISAGEAHDAFEAAGVTEQQAASLESAIESDRDKDDTFMDLAYMIDGTGIPKKVIRSVISRHGRKAAGIIRNDPFLLMYHSGVGFLRADAVWKKLKLPLNSPRRQQFCLYHMIKTRGDGSTWINPHNFIHDVSRLTGSTPDVIHAVQAGIDEDMFVQSPSGKLSLCTWDHDEYVIAEEIRDRAGLPSHWPDVSKMEDVTEHQIDQVTAATQKKIGMFHGKPGSGKTHTVSRLVALCLERNLTVEIAAPTGKAAMRINRSLPDGVMATTIHRMIQCLPQMDEDFGKLGEYTMGYGEYEFEPDVLIIDEASMCDAAIMARLLKATSRETQILLVFDLDQLPPVGVGCPARDILKSGMVGVGYLTEIHRNSGEVSRWAARVSEGERPRLHQGFNGNLCYVEVGPKAWDDYLPSLIASLNGIGYNPLWDAQFLAGNNDSVEMLNEKLRNLLNNAPDSGSYFRVGDKVAFTQNKFYSPADDRYPHIPDYLKSQPACSRIRNVKGELFVANGEQGVVQEAEQRWSMITLAGGETVMVPRKASPDNAGCAVVLSYAITVHKSQGDEWPVVVFCTFNTGKEKRVMSRNLVYTAVTRCRDYCIVAGFSGPIYNSIMRVDTDNRFTKLTERMVSPDEEYVTSANELPF